MAGGRPAGEVQARRGAAPARSRTTRRGGPGPAAPPRPARWGAHGVAASSSRGRAARSLVDGHERAAVLRRGPDPVPAAREPGLARRRRFFASSSERFTQPWLISRPKFPCQKAPWRA